MTAIQHTQRRHDVSRCMNCPRERKLLANEKGLFQKCLYNRGNETGLHSPVGKALRRFHRAAV